MSVKLLPHNNETYQRMIGMFQNDDRVAVVQPTGTGKSFLMLKWIEDNPRDSIVVISPSNVLFTQLHRYAKESDLNIDHIEMHTYQKLDRSEDYSIELLNADKIILDEFHRTGAEKWYKSIDILLASHPASKVLGLTATPIRYLDNYRDMANKIFNNNLARYMTLGEAIDLEILPVPKYIPVWYDYNDKLTRYQKDINSVKNIKDREECERLLKEMKNHLENSYKAEDVFKKNMPTNHGKYIVFCKNNEHLALMKEKMYEWLKEINTNITYYTSVSDDYDKDIQIQSFIDDTDDTAIKLLFCINRLNEGLHVQGIDGVIMLRPTKSGIVYLQQMGRAFATENETPIIFDMVNNYENVKALDPDDLKYYNIFERQLYNSSLVRKLNNSNLHFRIFEDIKKFNEIFKPLESILYHNKEQIWNEKFELLKEFKEEFNRLPTSHESYKNVNIGDWTRSQRILMVKNNISPEKYKKLLSIGILPKINNRGTWNEKFELLKEFKEEFNRLPLASESYGNVNIGQWLTLQKSNFNASILHKDYRDKLESIGVIFGNPYNIIWNEKFELLKEFKEEFNRFPSFKDTYKNIKIGSWFHVQKSKFNKGKLSDEYIYRLESIGAVLINTDYETRWNEKFELLKEFKEEFNRFPGKNETYKDIDISEWVQGQRSNFRKGKLSDDKIKKLKSIDFNFYTDRDKIWNEWLELLKEFKEEFNRLPYANEKYINKNIGSWVNNQRLKFSKGKLSDDKVEKLESLGVYFYNKLDKIWDETFELICNFKEEFNRLPTSHESYKNVNVGIWMHIQKRNFRKGVLSDDKINKLKSIDFNFKISDRYCIWDEKFELLKEFKEEFNRFPDGNETYKDITIGRWYKDQLKNYNKNKLLDERTKKLQSIGVIFKNTSIKTLEERWNEKFEILAMYIIENFELPMHTKVYKNVKIGEWFYRQIKKFEEGKLSDDKVEKLESLGVVFKKKKDEE